MKTFKFTTILPPSTNDYLGKRVIYSSGRPIVSLYETKKAKDFKKITFDIIKKERENNDFQITDKNTFVILKLKIYMNKKRKDSDNMLKVILDTIVQSNLVVDDDIILPSVQELYIDKFNPRVEVELIKSDKCGIFKDEKELIAFIKNNCEDCIRYKRNCSILKKSKENYITKEVDKDKLTCISKK